MAIDWRSLFLIYILYRITIITKDTRQDLHPLFIVFINTYMYKYTSPSCILHLYIHFPYLFLNLCSQLFDPPLYSTHSKSLFAFAIYMIPKTWQRYTLRWTIAWSRTTFDKLSVSFFFPLVSLVSPINKSTTFTYTLIHIRKHCIQVHSK